MNNERILWEREDGKKLEFEVKNITKFYADGKYMGDIHYLYPLKDGYDKVLKFNNVHDNGNEWTVKVTDSKVAIEILQRVENNKKEIEKYFEKMDNVKLHELSNGSIVFTEETEEYKEIEALNTRYFFDKKREWIKENKKYFTVDKGWEKNESNGMMYPYANYFFSKDNIEKVDKEIAEYKATEEYKEKQRKIKESSDRFDELYVLAKEMTDEDFEDVVGLPREHFLD